jgi:Tfp pilus assembly protein PilO
MKAPSLGTVWRAGYARPFLILLALNLVFFASFTFWRGMEERRLSVKAIALRQAIAEKRKAAIEIERQVKILNDNATETKRFYAETVKGRKDELSSTLQRLVALAADLGIRTPHLAWKPEDVKGANLVKVEVTMPVTGTYQQLGGLLQKLERAPDFVIVRQVQMQGRPVDGAADLDVKLEAYFRGEKP